MNKLLIVILFALMACTDDHLAPVEPSPFGPQGPQPQAICESPKKWEFELFNYAQTVSSTEKKWTALKIKPDEYTATTSGYLRLRITNTGTVKIAFKRLSVASYTDILPGAYVEWSTTIFASGSNCPNITDKSIDVWVKLRECRQSGCSWGAELSTASATNFHTVGTSTPGFTAIINPNSCPGGVAIVP